MLVATLTKTGGSAMDQQHSTTSRPRGKHLTFEERVIIQTRLKDGWKPPAIAREIGCSSNTVRNEIKQWADSKVYP